MSTAFPQKAEPAVPKFRSFKPKKPSTTAAKLVDDAHTQFPGRSSGDALGRTRGDDPHRGDRRSHSHRSRDDRRNRHSDIDNRDRDDVKQHKEHSLTTDESEESDLFIVDRRGDSKNVEYGSLHRYSVPLHYRTGYGRVIGASASNKIDRSESTDKYVVLTLAAENKHERPGRILGSSKGQTFSERGLRVILPVAAEAELETNIDFVSFGAGTRKRKRGAESPTETATGREAVDYRSIEGKAKPRDEASDEDLELATDPDDDVEQDRTSQETRQQNATLARRTKEHPTDHVAWVALIHHQAELIRPDVHFAQLTNSEKRALADIRLSIYEQALRHVTKGKAGHADLVLGMIEQCGLLLESSRLTAKWAEVLKEHPDDIKIWTRYLDFVQTNHVAFRYEQCRDAYLRCLAILHEARTRASDETSKAVCEAQIYVLSRFTYFVRDAGHDELAYAIWQALIECHFFAPPGVSEPSVKLEALEEFWDTDYSRVGENNAQGWAQYDLNFIHGARCVISSRCPTVDPSRPFLSFAASERQLQVKLHLPATTDDDSGMDDPFRSVMFSDIRSCIEHLQDSLPDQGVLNAFLGFMGLPRIPGIDEAPPGSQADQFMTSASRTSSSSARVETTLGLFHDAFAGVECNDWDPASTAFVDRALGQLASVRLRDECLMEYYIAHKLAFFPDEAIKTAKKMLKTKPTSLRLYNAYALVESKLGRPDRAAEVWSTALRMSHGFADEERYNNVLLWHSWIFTLSRQDSGAPKAIQRLLAMCDPSTADAESSPTAATISTAQRLRIARACETGWECMLYVKRPDLAMLYAECHMLFAYLGDAEGVASTVEQRKRYSARLERSDINASNELLHQAQADLVKRHIDRHRPYRPAVLRTELIESLRLYPSNGVILDCYLRVGAQTRFDDRIRASLHDDPITGPQATIVGWTFAIAEEIRRCTSENAGSTDHALRSLFTRALRLPESKVKHSVALWRQWLAFELPSRHEEMQPPTFLSDAQRQQALLRAKQVFLDGLRMLPWCKAWIIDGLHDFAREGGMTAGELERVYDVLGARELRVRMPVEEMEEAIAGL